MCTVSKVAEEPLRGRLWSVWLWHGEYASQQSFLFETLSFFYLFRLISPTTIISL